MKTSHPLIQQSSTLFLRATVLAMGLAVLVICALVLPAMHREWVIEFPHLSEYRYPVLAGLTVSAMAFFVALFQTMKLLNLVDANNAFSEQAVQALKRINYSACVISVIFAVAMPLIFYIGDNDDAPGLILIGLIFVFAPIAVAVFAATLQKLLHNAIALKSENELTV